MDINRKLEQWLIGQLQTHSAALADMSIYGAKGDSVIEPPFIVVQVVKATEIATRSNVYRCEGVFQLITGMYETTAEQHAEMLSQIKPAFDAIGAACPISDPSLGVVVSGLDVTSFDSKDSPSDRAHADIIAFSAGVSGRS